MYSIAKCIKSRYLNVAEEGKWYIISKHNLNCNTMFISKRNYLISICNDYQFDLDNIITIGDKVSSRFETVKGIFTAFRPLHEFPFGIKENETYKVIWTREIKKSNIKKLEVFLDGELVHEINMVNDYDLYNLTINIGE